MKQYITNCHLISPGLELPCASVEISDGRISAIHEGDHLPENGAPIFDAQGCHLLPGFIDIHTHGAGGGDFSSGRGEDLQTMARAKLREGVTCFLPTTMTADHAAICAMLRSAASYVQSPGLPRMPGVHLEGPFINPKCAGAQNPAFVRLPDLEEFAQFHAIAPIRIVSLAVEMTGGMEFVRSTMAQGIVTSLAHTSATHAQFLEAKAAGLGHLTHFCNQMTPLHHREIGIVGSGLLDPDIRIELICDGIHLAPEMIQLVFALKPMDQLMLITDSIQASQLGDGEYMVGSLKASVHNGAARLADGTLAGSTLTMNDALRNVQRITGRPLHELVATTSWNQAQSLGLKDLGKIEPAYHADLVLLNHDFTVMETFVAGHPALDPTSSRAIATRRRL